MYSISVLSLEEPIIFAAQELKKYLRMMMPSCGNIEIDLQGKVKDGFRIGLMSDFGLDTSDAKDLNLDDILYIETSENGGIIAGSNGRSVLMSVYKYLKLNGCRFLFPGVDGEYIPKKDIAPQKYRKMADMRYRGQCNEGTESQQNMIDAIDFAPKAGLNAFMLEFEVPFFYYDRWYSHRYNSKRIPEPITADTIRRWKRMCEDEITKRGLQFHDMGHGWTIEPFGYDTSTGWFNGSDINKGKETKYLSMLDGERKLYNGIPLCTNFCMSNQKARKICAEYVADYAEKNTHVDIIHVWLADDANNHCECDECQKKTASDWYIMLLNDIDKALSKRNLTHKVAFIAYVDTLWAPLEEKLLNPDRFALLFAPIKRVYTQSYGIDADTSDLQPYMRNKLIQPASMEQNLGYLKKWTDYFKGDAIAYEYHFFAPLQRDAGGMSGARSIYEDIINLKKHALCGMIEDQTQRCAFPTGFPVYIYGEALFDTSVSFEEVAKDYYSHAFGEDWKAAYDYLNELSELFDFEYILGSKRKQDAELVKQNKVYYMPKMQKNFQKAAKLMEEFEIVAESHILHKDRVVSVSWQLLYCHAKFFNMVAKAYEQKCIGNEEKGREFFDASQKIMEDMEIYLDKYFDMCLFYECSEILPPKTDGYKEGGMAANIPGVI